MIATAIAISGAAIALSAYAIHTLRWAQASKRDRADLNRLRDENPIHSSPVERRECTTCRNAERPHLGWDQPTRIAWKTSRVAHVTGLHIRTWQTGDTYAFSIDGHISDNHSYAAAHAFLNGVDYGARARTTAH